MRHEEKRERRGAKREREREREREEREIVVLGKIRLTHSKNV